MPNIGRLRLSAGAARAQDRAMNSSLPAVWPPWAAIRSPPLRKLFGFAVFMAGFTIAYHLGMSLNPTLSAPFWFPDAVLVSGLLCTRTRWWWLLLLATLPVRLLIDVPPTLPGWFLAAVYVNDCLKAALAAFLLKRFLPDPLRLNSMRELGLYFGLAVLLVPLLSALGGAAAGTGVGRSFSSSFEQWFLGNAMASLIITPIFFYWFLRPPNPRMFSLPRVIEAGAISIGLLVTLRLAFESGNHPTGFVETRSYLPVPFLVWAAIRFRMYGATVAAALLSCFAVNAALTGTGSFGNFSARESANQLQHFLLLRVAPLYLAAVLIEQWARVSDVLRESEQRFRVLADHAPVMMWLGTTTAGCEFANLGWLKFTGMTLEQTVGDGWSNVIHPEDLQPTYDRFLADFSARQPTELEYRVRRHDGEYRWILARGNPRFDARGQFLGYAGSAIDLTERRQHEAALKRSEARYRDVVENQTSFVCRMLPNGTLTFVNSTYCRFLGRARMDLLGESFLDVLSPAARDGAREALAAALDRSTQTGWECEVARPDGTRGWQNWVCHAIESSGDEPRELQAIGYDITDRKRAEESGRQLAHATRFAAVGELTAMVAHEINQPLCAILSNAEAGEILLRLPDPPLEELRQILADIRKDDLRADSAIRSIRSLLQRREFLPGSVDLFETVDHVFKLTAGDALHRRVPMRREMAHDVPAVLGDRSYLEQVLVILMVNGMDAMKSTPESSRELVVSARRNAEGVEVAVQDRGHGISAEHMPQLFDSFFTTKADGMGMGLSIARSMVAAHGGRIWADNLPAGGAMFRFTIPEFPRPA
jgi:PAS domain S-box-containing protein